MPDVPPPKLPLGHPDRQLECEELLEDAFLDVAARAEAAGWHASEIALALVSLAENHVLALAENGETDRAIAAAKTKLQ